MGQYSMRVFFGLVSLGKEAIFDISIEGTRVSSLLRGWSSHDDQVFAESLVYLLNGTATICFHSVGLGDPAIISFELLQVEDTAYNGGQSRDNGVVQRTVTRLNYGARKGKFDEDYNGDIWGGNRFWSPKKAGARIITVNAIKNASASPNFYPEELYQSALVSRDEELDLSYTMEAEPGKNYSVWLHFAEIDDSITLEGERVFDVLVNGNTVFEDEDIIKLTGESYTALVLNSTVSVTGKSLVIVLHPKLGSHALISAIEIFEVIKMESRTSRDEVIVLQLLKKALRVPSRTGWNGDPCVPQQHPWNGVHCQLDGNGKQTRWFIDALLKGLLTSNISTLKHLHNINLSHNNIHGGITASLGYIKSLEVLDLSYNSFNGSVPGSLRELTSLRILKLEGNPLLENVAAPVRESKHHTSSHRQATIISVTVSLSFLVIAALVCAAIWWRRQQDITRAQHKAAGRAPYAKFELPL
ncbi:hypothetical protein AALP_AA3G108000 [Arabis alpina]|uniref:Malectin-like domain-containing protein n=1 Tax=Arabis alpina TaxID=50452 RepID=A0A087H8E7_ARAAL|nr:hypothetical protein AALP_AA3G108000 [Arabis alpina]